MPGKLKSIVAWDVGKSLKGSVRRFRSSAGKQEAERGDCGGSQRTSTGSSKKSEVGDAENIPKKWSLEKGVNTPRKKSWGNATTTLSGGSRITDEDLARLRAIERKYSSKRDDVERVEQVSRPAALSWGKGSRNSQEKSWGITAQTQTVFDGRNSIPRDLEQPKPLERTWSSKTGVLEDVRAIERKGSSKRENYEGADHSIAPDWGREPRSPHEKGEGRPSYKTCSDGSGITEDVVEQFKALERKWSGKKQGAEPIEAINRPWSWKSYEQDASTTLTEEQLLEEDRASSYTSEQRAEEYRALLEPPPCLLEDSDSDDEFEPQSAELDRISTATRWSDFMSQALQKPSTPKKVDDEKLGQIVEEASEGHGEGSRNPVWGGFVTIGTMEDKKVAAKDDENMLL